uniref:LOW QUALITY PROTEIN: uncharacterized protein LOC120330355 n=1 Tax=Styela clava TaxID=7725 RepID=UPI0019392E9E|nr:LOW QUALITY PROTEIN: uncharacterized protein LOC120330355 [Styela clava]
MVVIQAICCQCGYNRHWESQDSIGGISEGNILLSASILFGGVCPKKVLRSLCNSGIRTIAYSTYQRHQDKNLQPVIVASWVEQRAALLAGRRGMPLTIGGDDRADSRGHSAKFGCYTIMDLKTNEIIDMKLIQKNEVTSSNHMELEGLKRGIDALLEEGIRIGELITDRHPSVTKWVCENLGRSIFLTFGTLPKVLVKRLTQRLNLLIVAYCKSGGGVLLTICTGRRVARGAMVTGDGDMVEQKVMSLLRHIRNVHTGHGNLYMECQHAPLGDEEEKRKKWIFPGQRAYDELESLFDNFRFKKDIRKLSPLDQTSGLEGFHSLLNHFAPKMLSYGYKGIFCRMLLAVLHHNANSGRPQAKTKDGCLQYEVLYPRGKMGQHTVRRVRSEPCYAYVKVLLQKVISEVDGSSTTSQGDLSLISSPPPTLSSRCERPDKELANQELQSRFNS